MWRLFNGAPFGTIAEVLLSVSRVAPIIKPLFEHVVFRIIKQQLVGVLVHSDIFRPPML